MTEIPRLGLGDLNPEQQSLWRYIVEGPRGNTMGKQPETLSGPFGPWLHNPKFGRSAAEMGEILRINAILPGDLREIAILAAGVRWKSEFEFWAHAQAARAEGLEEDVLEAMQAGKDPPFRTERQRLVYTVSMQLLDSGDLTRDLRNQLVEELGWPATVELVAIVGFYCMVAFTLNAFDVRLPKNVPSFWPRG